MRRQQQRGGGVRSSGGFGGAWSGWDADVGAEWSSSGGGFSGTARDFMRKATEDFVRQSNPFSGFGDFFNQGFAEAPVADNAQRASYFDRWFSQVKRRRAVKRFGLQCFCESNWCHLFDSSESDLRRCLSVLPVYHLLCT
jgi:hypothetical protein